MNIISIPFFRTSLLVSLIGSSVYLTYGKAGPRVVHIAGSAARIDFLTQVKFLRGSYQQNSVNGEIHVIYNFQGAQETALAVAICDLRVLLAIDHQSARLPQVNKDLELLGNELSSNEQQETLGR